MIKGLTIKNESKRQRKVDLYPEGLVNSKCKFFNGFSHRAMMQFQNSVHLIAQSHLTCADICHFPNIT